MKKIGVLVFSGTSQIKVGRDGRSDYSFDGIEKRGINKIISDVNGPVEFCSTATIDEYEHVLVSLTSYHDVLNLVNNVPKERKASIHIGGPACNNINPILPFIDTANFGRCDNGKINRIIAGDCIESVWRKGQDPAFEGKYAVDASTSAGLAADEKSFGCRQKCAFCFYSHWNGHVSRQESNEKYASGFGDYEDFFQSLNWERAIRGAVTAIDGTTETTRMKVRKPITFDDVKRSLLRSNEVKTKTRLRVKIYSIVGYPWEGYNELAHLDLVRAASEVDKEIQNQITIRMHFSHFIPFQKTPMWKAAFNFSDYRKWCLRNPMLYDSGKIRIFSGGTFTPSPAPAAVSTVIQRAGQADSRLVRQLATRQFTGMDSGMQILFLKKNASHLLELQDKQSIPNINTPNKIIEVEL